MTACNVHFPKEIIDRIIDFLPVSLNVCLVNKDFKRQRKPVTMLTADVILQAYTWLVDEMTQSSIQQATNALEFSIWTCLKHDRLDIAEIYKKQIIAKDDDDDDDDLHCRVECYFKTHEHNVNEDDMKFDYMSCVNSGNLAWYLCAEHNNVDMPSDPHMVTRSIEDNNLLFATYMLQHSHYSNSYDSYEAFLQVSNTALVKWFVPKFLNSSSTDKDMVIEHLAACGNIEALQYFHTTKQYNLTFKALKYAKSNGHVNVVNYIKSSRF